MRTATALVVRLVLLGLVGIATPAPAQTQPPATQPSAQQRAAAPQQSAAADALAGALAGTPAGLATLTAYLDGVHGVPDQVADRAIAMIQALGQMDIAADPVGIQQAADRIAEIAARALRSAYIVKVQVDRAFNLGAGRTGLDFGPPDVPPMPDFAGVNARDPRLSGELQNFRRPTGDPLLSTGIRGVQSVRLPVANGSVRLILLTDAFNTAAIDDQPFGAEVELNGVAIRVGQTKYPRWLEQAFLTTPGPYMAKDFAADLLMSGVGNDSGGVIALVATVNDGVLSLTIRPSAGKVPYVTGIVLEPVADESVLYGRGDARDVLRRAALGQGPGASGEDLAEEIKDADARIQAAVAELLSAIVSAAGPEALAALANLPEPIADTRERVSEN